MASTVYPTADGRPVCARPTDKGPCLHEVSVPGAPCRDHRGLSPVDTDPVSWEPADPQWSL